MRDYSLDIKGKVAVVTGAGGVLCSMFAETLAEQGAKVAVVFGNERTGLTDEQLNQCTAGVTIPSSDGFGSLNLSHAVQ